MAGVADYNQPYATGIAEGVNPITLPNYTQQATQATTLKDLRLRNQLMQNEVTQSNLSTGDALATRDALSNNLTQDPTTGQLSVDYAGTLKELNDGGHGLAALNFQQAQQERVATIAEKQATLQATQLSNQSAQINLAGQVLQHIQASPDPQKALDNLNIVAQQNPQLYGSIAHVIPKTYDPDTFGQYVDQAEKTSDFINQKIEVNRLGLTATKQNADILQMANSATNEVAGQYKDDPNTKEYVAMANTYTSFKSMQQSGDFAKGLQDRDLVYNFQNIINPMRSATGSTTEQDEEARSVLQGWGVDMKKVMGGDQLAPEQRQQISAFIENKYQQSTLKQQAVFNQYQNRLVHMSAQGQPVDPYHALPTYGDIVQNAPKSAVDHSGDVDKGAPGIQIDGTAPPISTSDLYKPTTPSANPPPPPATAFQGGGAATGPVISRASIDARAERTGELPADIIAKIKAKGGRIEGE